ncbi:MAG: GNAT family N-acetyltransferase [Solirubrobacteraceae bacterium]
MQTARTVMRGWREGDLDAYAAMSADPEVTRFIGGLADRQQAWRAMATHLGHWALRGYGLWAVQRTSDQLLLGRVGLWQPEGWPGLEVGWQLRRSAWGHGYAQETARAAIDWAWAALDTPRLISLIDPRNTASIRVAERLGMRPVGVDVVRGEPVTMWGIQRPSG